MVEETSEEFENGEPQNKVKIILWYLSLIIGFGLVILYWGLFINLNELVITIEPWVPKISVALLTIFIVNLLIKMTRPVFKSTYRSRGGSVGDWKVISSVYTYVIWVLTGLVVFTGIFGSLSSLGISLGIIGAGLAFALQQPILSFGGWFLIMIKRPFNIGDRIVLTKEGVMGDVDDITMFYFILKEITPEESQTGKSVIVPNSAVFQGSITNYSYDTPHVWHSIPVSITYESDLDLAEKLLFEAANDVAGPEMKKAARLATRIAPESVQADLLYNKPLIRVEFSESSINLNIRILCLPKQLRTFRTEIYRSIYNYFKQPENGERVEIAYPHIELVAHRSIKGLVK